MNVKELIEQLQKCRPDAEVFLEADGIAAAGKVYETADDSEGSPIRRGAPPDEWWWEVYIVADD